MTGLSCILRCEPHTFMCGVIFLKKRIVKLKRRIVESMDFPAEAALGLVRVQLLGREKMYVENHRGVLAYRAACIRLKTEEGVLRIEGESMTLCELRRDRLYISGQIAGLFYEMPQ